MFELWRPEGKLGEHWDEMSKCIARVEELADLRVETARAVNAVNAFTDVDAFVMLRARAPVVEDLLRMALSAYNRTLGARRDFERRVGFRVNEKVSRDLGLDAQIAGYRAHITEIDDGTLAARTGMNELQRRHERARATCEIEILEAQRDRRAVNAVRMRQLVRAVELSDLIESGTLPAHRARESREELARLVGEYAFTEEELGATVAREV